MTNRETGEATSVHVGEGALLAEAARLAFERGATSLLVGQGARAVATISREKVVRGLRRARPDTTVSALLRLREPGSNPGPGQDPPIRGFDPTDETATPFQPDALLPSQYFDRVGRSAEGDPERRLLVAVLELGLRDYVKLAGSRDHSQQAAWRETEDWVEDRDATGLFSFENLCHVLDIDPSYLRQGLHVVRERSGRRETETAVGATDLGRRFRDAARRRLRTERADILRRVAVTEEEIRLLSGERESELEDRAQSEGTAAFLQRLDDRGRQEIEDIDAAMARLEEGAYGICVDCGCRISFGRLQAVPTARLCTECARAHEGPRRSRLIVGSGQS